MTALGGLLLVAHGLVHAAIWLPEPNDGAPFDPGHSWLLRDARPITRVPAVAACVVLVVAGVLVLAGSGLGATLSVAGATISLVLVVVTFNRWLVGAGAIDVAIALVVLTTGE